MVYDINGNVISDDSVKTDIVSLNPDARNRLTQAKRAKREPGSDPSGFLESTQPLTLFWFTDIHGSQTALQRLVDFRDNYTAEIDDTICTGDMVEVRYSDGMGFWDAVSGSDNIMTCIGNHETWNPNRDTLATQAAQYSQYFAPYISHWGNIQIESGKTYYYKDYTEKNIRLIMVNCMLSGSDETAQETWFTNTLASAKTAGLCVVIGSHYPPLATLIDCNFSNLDSNPSVNGALPEFYSNAVQSFIDGGGTFICYLVGHWHTDVFCHGRTNTSQYTIIMDAANMTYATEWGNDNVREVGKKSQDLANLLVIDTSCNTVKLVRVGADMDRYLRTRNCFSFNYLTGEIITEW